MITSDNSGRHNQAISLDNLPKYSPWPARLLQTSERIHYQKNRENVLREFEKEKWQPIFKKLQLSGQHTLENLEKCLASDNELQIYSEYENLYLTSPREIQKIYSKKLIKYLQNLGSAQCIAELGSGAGNLILQAAQRLSNIRQWAAYELTQNGRLITNLIATHENLQITTHFLDFDNPLFDQNESTQTIYYSSFSLAYCKNPQNFLNHLLKRRPTELLFIEPIYQFFAEDRLLGLLARRYFEYNDYSTELWPILERMANDGRIEIIQIDKNFFGHNPLCPVSAIHVRPL